LEKTEVIKVSRKTELEDNPLITPVYDAVPKTVLANKNRRKSWKYGYDATYDFVVISKTGEIGDVIRIQNLDIALPKTPKKCSQRHKVKKEQYWERTDIPEPLAKINTVFQWHAKPNTFKDRWVDYIEEEFEKREKGHWFMNNGIPTYLTGGHYMYIQWSEIDIGYPDFREANRALFLHWEACRADNRSFGQQYLKIRRSGFSCMESSECVNIATLAKKGRIGILSKTGADAKKMFTDKVVPISAKYPFFFKPIQDGSDKPKSELAYRVPAQKITKNNMHDSFSDDMVGLDTSIDWRNTDSNAYDGEKLLLLAHDESGKWEKPNDILKNWGVTKTCLLLGRKIVGKCMMGSTNNALKKGGAEFKKLYRDSDVTSRSKNGRTKSGLYSLFIPMEWNFEGYIDVYGMPVFNTPDEPILGIDGEWIVDGAIDFWKAEVEALKSDPDALNEHYRQFPRTEAHAFRDESNESLFNLTKIYQQVDYNDSLIMGQHVTRYKAHWKNGVLDSKVIFTPDKKGRFLTNWTPEAGMQNRIITRGGQKYPANKHLGAFGCDSYDISGVVGGGGSNGALHGLTGFHMDNAPVNEFFLEYIARPQTAEIFYEDVLMACVFFGMPILCENNKPRILYHFKNRGYRQYSMNRPDKVYNKLSKTEKELGGVPNTSEAMKGFHATAIESYVEEFVGEGDGHYRPEGEMGDMIFMRTLEDWAKFDITKRTKYDASISSGLAIMAVNKHRYQPTKEKTKIKLKFARYNQSGNRSEIIE